MKLSFSTLSCPDWRFGEIYATAADLGFDGIELRGVADEMYAPRVPEFSTERVEETVKSLASRGLELPILTSGAYVLGNPDLDAARIEVEDYCALAQRLGVKYVRVLMEATPEPAIAPDFELAVKTYRELCAVAASYGVTLLTETNGFLADSAVCRRFMESVDAPNMGLIWDVHHTYRFFNEDPEKTVEVLGKYIKHVHLKDSVKGSNGRITYMLTGYGDFPFERAVAALSAIGYDGYLSYEWVKRWSRELAEPGVALFQYINYLKTIV